MAALVRHADPPAQVPIDLAAFVHPVGVDGETADWRLTDDVIAFGEPDVVDRYVTWRSGWERCFMLDPAASIARLADVGEEVLGADAAEPLTALVADGFERVVEPVGLPGLVRVVDELGDALRRRDASGYGVVDATPGTTRVGLLAGWSPPSVPQVLVADDRLRVVLAVDGLRVEPAGRQVIVGVRQVTVIDDLVRIEHAAGVVDLEAARARPLTWLAPGAAVWRVRPVPEVIVWARTLSGIEEAARHGGALGLPVRFTCRL